MKNRRKTEGLMAAARLMTAAELNVVVEGLEFQCCVVKRLPFDGTITVTDGGKRVLSAIQKGHKLPWIVMFFESERIKWSNVP